ncbi:MAG: hypothetical protein WC412_08695, partial [Candidatus Omnitrophota bacterium]
TPKDSVINAWWDYGHFFKTLSGRRVIFDPQSQHMTLSYWMAQVLLTKNENEAINILRMLNNSSSTLFEEMQAEIKDDFQRIALLKRVLNSNEKEAREILGKQNISDKLKEKIMDTIFFKKPAPAYFVVDKSMIFKMYNISFLGNWNFSKVYVLKNNNLPKNKVIEGLMEIFSLSKEQAENIYSETILATTEDELNEILSSRYSIKFVVEKGRENNGVVYFDNGIVLNLADFSARALSIGEGYKKYRNVFVHDNNKISLYEDKDADYKEGMLFFKNNNEWKGVGLTKDLAQSLFAKLYFFGGLDLKYFEPFYIDKDGGMYIYKIKWPVNE